ncbi:uncharacterized protein LOC126678358 [Mercurialis annua]|uniref:uncharacterized protein LOC126678358 n=1 Tax=Mercurialis annua TaxID=3986 RepID=UPI002160DCCE|nr:uncharacterized protein LOC126678358 [Mercurialis annua]
MADLAPLSEPVPSPLLKEIGREPMEEDRSTKKAKFRENQEEDMVEVQDVPMSFKDKVLQADKERVVSISGTCDDFNMMEDDVIISNDEGLPMISFSNRVKEELSKPWRRSVVVKLLGRPIGFRNLCNRLKSMWNFTQGFDVIDLENDYFLVKLKSGCDVEAVLTGGPWVILGHYLAVKSWDEEFNCSADSIQSVHAWIRLPGMPIHYYNKKVLRYIGEMVGKVVKIDYCTELAERGKFARIAVEVDLTKPLVSQFKIDGIMQKVEYECMPRICFHCGKFGHVKDHCPELFIARNADIMTNVQAGAILSGESEKENSKGNNQDTNKGQAMRDNSPSYGPWMMVGRRGRTAPVKRRDSGNQGTAMRNSRDSRDLTGSRFHILEDEDKENTTEVGKSPIIKEVVEGINKENTSPNIQRDNQRQHAKNDGITLDRLGPVLTQKTNTRGPKISSNPVTKRFNMSKVVTSLNPENHSAVNISYEHASSSNALGNASRGMVNQVEELQDMDMVVDETVPPDIDNTNPGVLGCISNQVTGTQSNIISDVDMGEFQIIPEGNVVINGVPIRQECRRT